MAHVAIQRGDHDVVRSTLHALGFDDEQNPMGKLIQPGQTVLIKPNLVLHEHPAGGDLQCLITQGSVVGALVDFVRTALRGDGRIILGDAPLQGTDFQKAVERSGMAEVIGPDVELIDFRQVHAVKDRHGHIQEWQEVEGDPSGYVDFDLGDESALAPIEADSKRFRVSKYRPDDTKSYHEQQAHRYVIAGSVLDADVVIGVPKLKTHCKVGVTLGMKNFVGIVGRKQCLAHHRDGGAGEGGDEYPGHSTLKRLSVKLNERMNGNPSNTMRSLMHLALRVNYRLMKLRGEDFILDGEWHGNDTCWRMVHDLNRIVRYGKRDGTLSDQPMRPVLTLIDGLTAGEGNGPLQATAKNTHCIIGGLEPAAVDIAAARFMGFDYRKIPLLREMSLDVSDLTVALNDQTFSWDAFKDLNDLESFAPPPGWVGTMEWEPNAHTVC